tara:strand:+ start:1665 stop:2756 length:1092 start_codon:yes stop_codon:yes gene_type:complete
MNKTLVFFFLFTVHIGYSQNKLEIVDYKYLGLPYYPEQFLSKKDSLKWPIEFDISLDVKDIKGLNITSEEFTAKILISSYSKYGHSFISESNDTINLRHSEFFEIYIKENNLKNTEINSNDYLKSDSYDYLFYDGFKSKSVKLIEGPFDHNWDLRNFPFDKQKLKFKFVSTVDSSIVRLRPSRKFKSTFETPMENLKDGFNIESISYNYKYNTDESDLIMVSPGNTRGIVTETLEIIVNVNRQGSWLFLKLFMGGILSFLISCLVFLLPVKKELESKVTLAVGAIFGAIGNRYFVDSVLPGVQLFTKADAISNLVIFMVVFNILIMLLQNSDKTFFKYFQSTKNALFYSIYIFIILFVAILIW